ncbi:MAG: ComF family protein [Candidatus Omnitrophota bacterium]
MLRALLKGLRDLIYPECCLACKKSIHPNQGRDFICTSCRDGIEMNLPPFCAYCGRHLDGLSLEKNICPGCLSIKFNFDRAFSPCKYSGTIKKLIHEFKYSGSDYLGRDLGKIMNNFIRAYDLPIEYMDFIIPVPLHNSRLRQREFNQAQILSEQVAGEFNKEVLAQVLIRNRMTKTQTGLDPQERWINVEESFCVTRPEMVRERNLLLVDDVLTTGATSSQAAKSLKESGARNVFLLTLAS